MSIRKVAAYDLQNNSAMCHVGDRFHLAIGSEQGRCAASDFPWIVKVLQNIGKEDVVESIVLEGFEPLWDLMSPVTVCSVHLDTALAAAGSNSTT